jgi:hypothetical protein
VTGRGEKESPAVVQLKTRLAARERGGQRLDPRVLLRLVSPFWSAFWVREAAYALLHPLSASPPAGTASSIPSLPLPSHLSLSLFLSLSPWAASSNEEKRWPGGKKWSGALCLSHLTSLSHSFSLSPLNS